eukprot:1332854-Rhodomonas_salina.2
MPYARAWYSGAERDARFRTRASAKSKTNSAAPRQTAPHLAPYTTSVPDIACSEMSSTFSIVGYARKGHRIPRA